MIEVTKPPQDPIIMNNNFRSKSVCLGHSTSPKNKINKLKTKTKTNKEINFEKNILKDKKKKMIL